MAIERELIFCNRLIQLYTFVRNCASSPSASHLLLNCGAVGSLKVKTLL